MTISSPVGTVGTYTFTSTDVLFEAVSLGLSWPTPGIYAWLLPPHDGDVRIFCVGGKGGQQRYSVGDVASYDGVLYRVVQAHRSQADWTPDKTPALWTPVRETTGATPDPFVQPTGAADAYSKGDRVTFEGAVWGSVIDANVWSPSAYPAGWKAV